MITIKFSDPDTELEALGFLLGRFPGRALRTGEVLVPETALQALALEGYQFTVIGKSTYEQQTASIRGYCCLNNIMTERKFRESCAALL